MSITRPLALALAAVALTFPLTALTPARAKNQAPWIHFQHRKATIGRPARLLGAHLRPNAFYPLLLAVPNLKHPRAEALFGPVKTNGRGQLDASVILPVVKRCGTASVYAYRPRDKSIPHATFTLTGCTASRRSIRPPPLPGPPKKKKH